MRRRRPIEDEELEPRWRADVRVGRRGDGARIARARKCWEERPSPKAVSVRAGDGANEGDTHSRGRALEQVHSDLDLLAVGPVRVGDGERRLRKASAQVRRGVHLDPVLLREAGIFRVGSGNDDATVVQKNGFGVVETIDDRCVENRNA